MGHALSGRLLITLSEDGAKRYDKGAGPGNEVHIKKLPPVGRRLFQSSFHEDCDLAIRVIIV
jgi:hypothetical protein